MRQACDIHQSGGREVDFQAFYPSIIFVLPKYHGASLVERNKSRLRGAYGRESPPGDGEGAGVLTLELLFAQHHRGLGLILFKDCESHDSDIAILALLRRFRGSY